ncbi:hypothetical protein OHC33_003309 [Knufia fluminis]|uniref:Uncharacterized protein n=1 Tax=Knufia fluminis TaxID=191047 RepID=A0AAN8EHI3_9EURO|nr:hypothetical protein OHC33_003309 [Knufia fluminis]
MDQFYHTNNDCGPDQQVLSLVAGQSASDSGHIVNNAHARSNQQAQRSRDNAIVEAQVHLSTTLGEDVGRSSFGNQATFLKARHIIGGNVKSSQITTCFENGTQSRQYLQCLNTYDALRERNDDTIPTDPEHKRALVGVLVQAFRSTANAKDKPKYLESFARNRYDNRLVEARCWQILEFCTERSKRQALLRLWGGDKTKSEGPQVRDTKFADRFDSIVNLLATWKKSCDRIYQAPFLPQLVDNPDWTMKQIVGNAVSNDRKAVLLDIAKQAEEDGVEPYSSPATTPSPTKRRKTTSTPSSSRRGSARPVRPSQATHRLPPPPFPSVPQLSASLSDPSSDDLHLPTEFSPSANQQHNVQTSPEWLCLQDSRSPVPTQSPAPNYEYSTTDAYRDNDANNFEYSGVDIGGETPWDGAAETPASRIATSTDLNSIFGLGSWQDDSTVVATQAAYTDAGADFGELNSSLEYDYATRDVGPDQQELDISRRVPRQSHAEEQGRQVERDRFEFPQANFFGPGFMHTDWQDGFAGHQ